MKEYVSYEQVVAAAIACYKESLTREEIIKLVTEIKDEYPDMIIANDIIRATKRFIICLNGSAILNPKYKLDDEIFVRAHAMTVKEYLSLYAGFKLVTFMNNKNETIKR